MTARQITLASAHRLRRIGHDAMVRSQEYGPDAAIARRTAVACAHELRRRRAHATATLARCALGGPSYAIA